MSKPFTANKPNTVYIDIPAHDTIPSIELTKASDITPEPVSWLWLGWLAAGKLHILGGAPGTGKTTISLSLASTITQGGRWPDGSSSPTGNVVIWSGEDDPADTLIPRLALSGANLDKVYFIGDVNRGVETRAFDPAKDMEPLSRKLAEIGNVRLLIVDPIVSAVTGDSHKNAEVRRGLQPLVDLAASMRCALIGITHFSKGTGGRDPVERITGSLAFGALARIVLVAAKPQEDEDGQKPRVFLRAKSNIGLDEGGYEYELAQGEMPNMGISTSAVVWRDALEGTARDLLATADSVMDGEGKSATDEAIDWLFDLLSAGSHKAQEIKRLADQAGFSWRTVQRAKKSAGIDSKRVGFGKGSHYIWRLPAGTFTADSSAGKSSQHSNENAMCAKKHRVRQQKSMAHMTYQRQSPNPKIPPKKTKETPLRKGSSWTPSQKNKISLVKK